MLCCLLQEATTCTKDSRLHAKYYACQEDEDQVVMRFCMDTSHGEGFAVIFVAPYVPSSNNHHISCEDGHWSSGSVCFSVPNLLRKFFRGLLYARSPRGRAQARYLFGHVALRRVWGHRLEYPIVVLAGDVNRTAFLPAFQDDSNTENFPSFSQLSCVIWKPETYPGRDVVERREAWA